MQFFSYPEVVAALVAACVSLIVAGGSGIYSIVRSAREISKLRSELLERAKIERYTASVEEFRQKYRDFKRTLGEYNQRLQSQGELVDGTSVVQTVLDFIPVVRDFYEDNRSLLEDDIISSSIEKIQVVIDRGGLNNHGDPGRIKKIQEVFVLGVGLADKVFEATTRY